MNKRTFFVDFDSGRLTDSIGGTSLTSPSLVAGSKPTLQFQFLSWEDNVATAPDLSDGIKWRCVVDTDLSVSTEPMGVCTSTDAITSGITSGYVAFPIDCTASGFIDKVNGKDSIPAWLEIYGLDEDDIPIYDYRLKVNCLGTIEVNHTES